MGKDKRVDVPNQVGWFVEPWREQAGGLSRQFVYNLINENKLPTAKIGDRRIILISPRDYLNQHRVEGVEL